MHYITLKILNLTIIQHYIFNQKSFKSKGENAGSVEGFYRWHYSRKPLVRGLGKERGGVQYIKG